MGQPGRQTSTPGSDGGGTDVVTGAAGFIGGRLGREVERRGRRVIAIDQRGVADDVGSHGTCGFVDAVRADLTEVDRLDRYFESVDTVYHLAARPGVQSSWGSAFTEYAHHNIVATQRVFEAALEAGVRRVVLASSSSVYGYGHDRPSRETDELAPVSPYGVSKSAAEQLADVYRERGLDVVVLRYFTVYGPGQRPDMAIHRMIAATQRGPAFPLHCPESTRRSFTFVDDVVDASIAAATTPGAARSTFNVGTDRAVTIGNLLSLVAELTGMPVATEWNAPRPGDPAQTLADTTRAHDVLGWRATTGIRAGLAAQIDWQRERSTGVSGRGAPAARAG